MERAKFKVTENPATLGEDAKVGDVGKWAYEFLSEHGSKDWNDYPAICAPTYRMPFEATWRVMAIVLPICVLFVFYFLAKHLIAEGYIKEHVFFFKWAFFAIGMVPALELGKLIDRYIARSRYKLKKVYEKHDFGRYELVQRISHRLGAHPDQITYAFLVKAKKVYETKYLPHLLVEYEQWYARDLRVTASRGSRSGNYRSGGYSRGSASQNDYDPFAPAFNTNGNYMPSGIGGVDVMGNTYGSD